MAATARAAEIVVLAGTNGAGKSSVAGAALRSRGGIFYDPDEATWGYVAEGLTPTEANARAWERGREQLERAIREGLGYAFETTLGGRAMTRLLLHAAAGGHAVRIWCVGLASPDLHVQRVRERAATDGHDIPEEKIRERWDESRKNLIRLLPHAREVVVFDNSRTVRIREGEAPRPVRLLHVEGGAIRSMVAADEVPRWAKPILAAALSVYPSARRR